MQIRATSTLSVVLASLALAASTAGCGGGSGACGVQPCGGDPVGNWHASSACADAAELNMAVLEGVMGFCSTEQHARFLERCPEIEQYIVDGGIKLIKIWLDSSDKEQKRRFEARMEDPLRQWKLSPMDLPSRSKWFEYSRARDLMLDATDTEHAPWHILRSDDKKRARLNCIHHILGLIPYKKLKREKVNLPDRSMKGAYDDEATLKGRKFVPEKY